MGDNSYMIGKKDGSPGIGISLENKAEVYNEATIFCRKNNLEVKTLNVTTTPAMPGQLGSTELQFKCVSQNYENAQPEYYKILNNNTLKASNTIDSEFMSYDDSTKAGVITLNTSLRGRDSALKMIGDICSSKNVALVSGKNYKKVGAVYTISDESYASNELTIKYNCIY